MVQYAIIQHFDQKLRKPENFYLATIFNERKLVLELLKVVIVKVKVTMKKFRSSFLLSELLDDLWYC